jgi:CDP-glucose 4,6-dehydratase
VSEVLSKLEAHWANLRWHVTDAQHPHEASLLYLDSAKARTALHWRPTWNFDTALEKTSTWYRKWMYEGKVISHEQLVEYITAAGQANAGWINQ